ncbi:hypothetical protein CEXT_662361 [Caerostris extrusa]|uniref:Uncharacterized protein n=1 Tax=Caerostris extrusa TaxID=172846 RepID=A0AAV4NC06_CAEEX|nr:hypothetical protein CEXT_662361 [Caerostris extrusa]
MRKNACRIANKHFRARLKMLPEMAPGDDDDKPRSRHDCMLIQSLLHSEEPIKGNNALHIFKMPGAPRNSDLLIKKKMVVIISCEGP